MGGRRFCNERRQLTEMHGPRCAYCHRYFLDSELSVDHIVPRALSGESIIRNMQLLCHPCHRMKDQPSTKLIRKNACIIKARILANYPLPNSVPPTANPPLPPYPPRAIQRAQQITLLPSLHSIPLASPASIPSIPFASAENNF